MSLKLRFGRPGNTSSTGFRGVRIGLRTGLAGRCTETDKWPAVLIPGIDCARDMAGARELVEDFDRRCPREYGEVFRGRYGMRGEEVTGDRGD
jgi:hypothetical protein